MLVLWDQQIFEWSQFLAACVDLTFYFKQYSHKYGTQGLSLLAPVKYPL